jgi:hypothetical protein
VQRLRVGYPKDEQSDRMAQDFFSYQSGAALYLGGSHSDYLSKGMGTLLTMADASKGTLAGAKTAARIARGVGQEFHDVDHDVVRRTTAGDFREAMHLTDVAMKTFRGNPSRDLNISLERVVRARAEMLIRKGDGKQAHDEMLSLAKELDKGGVKASVVEKCARDAEAIEVPGPKRRPKNPPK